MATAFTKALMEPQSTQSVEVVGMWQWEKDEFWRPIEARILTLSHMKVTLSIIFSSTKGNEGGKSHLLITCWDLLLLSPHWMAVRIGWPPAVLGVPSFLNRCLFAFFFPPWVSGISIAGAKRLLGSLRQLCSVEDCGSLLKWQLMVSAFGTLGLAGRMK